jgi:hypothetical protein
MRRSLSGCRGARTAAPGWDPVIAWGSPDAEALVPLLARFTRFATRRLIDRKHHTVTFTGLVLTRIQTRTLALVRHRQLANRCRGAARPLRPAICPNSVHYIIIHSVTGLILHCKTFSFRDIRDSTKPAGIDEAIRDRPLGSGLYHDTVVIMSCIESGDTEGDLERAAVHTSHMVHEWHKDNPRVVVLPFAHLSSDIAMPPGSLTMTNSFVNFLRAQGHSPRLITFGSHKDWMVDVYGYPRATSWFQFRH